MLCESRPRDAITDCDSLWCSERTEDCFTTLTPQILRRETLWRFQLCAITVASIRSDEMAGSVGSSIRYIFVRPGQGAAPLYCFSTHRLEISVFASGCPPLSTLGSQIYAVLAFLVAGCMARVSIDKTLEYPTRLNIPGIRSRDLSCSWG